MTTTAIKKQVDDFLPLHSPKQQTLALEMIKSLLDVDNQAKRISLKQYNKEIDEAVNRIENENSVTNAEAIKKLSKW